MISLRAKKIVSHRNLHRHQKHFYSSSTFQEMFQLPKKDTINYRKVTSDFIHTTRFEGKDILHVANGALSLLSSTAMKNVSHLFRSSHLQQLSTILKVSITFNMQY